MPDMNIVPLADGLAPFLATAKRNTYAGSDDDTTMPNPLLAQSMQLEFREGDWFYRDIYYGLARFSGLEAVFRSGKPVWTMAYSGGVDSNVDVDEAQRVYRFLRSALRNLPEAFPVRGPSVFRDAELDYRLTWNGDLVAFSGHEEIRKAEYSLYALTFAGGVLR
ncbi:MAG: DUF5680 domain-containing protein [bacterium]|nr:DUF5680 domain-containing protein [bacterium]MDE0239270.1 DUF5680 domain-containing protein [bacterium]MDE0416643.1 DUF5680 domain-containing protein [bacterium]